MKLKPYQEKIMNDQVRKIIDDMEDELIENGCFHELNTREDNNIIFDYYHYWDDYPEFTDAIQLETEQILAIASQLEQAGFSGFLWANDYVKNINI